MDLAQYRRINNIIERDSADATYKYALFQDIIGICQQSLYPPGDNSDQVSLLGLQAPRSDWQDRAFEHLTEKCASLIDVRGYAAWAI